MNRIHPHLNEVNLIGKLADLKESHYTNSLLLTSLIDLLIDKGLISTQELQTRAAELDKTLTPGPAYPIS